MTTVQIADDVRPSEAAPASGGGGGGSANGIYYMRNRSGTSLERRNTRLSRVISFKSADVEITQDEESGLRNEDDFKKRQTFRGKMLLWLAYQSVGVIYGDIGTSPLYVYSSTFTAPPNYDDLLGVLSIILWTLTMMVTVKYVLVILRADNNGEGGTFSCYSLLSRYANITNRDPREQTLVKMERYKTGELYPANRHVRSGIEKSPVAKGLLKVIGVLAVSMVMSDGVLTPAQSVLGAVQGIGVADPTISKATIVGTTCGILILLFLIQPLGTTKLASTFAPIVILWLGFNAAFGVYNLVQFDATVLKAFNPAYAFEFLIRKKTEGWRQLGGVLLSFTGVEALFADLGAFSIHAIQLSWLCYTFPCLLLAYIGQAAYISVHPSAYSNPFYNAVPPGMLYPALVVGILAAIVASQAIITATFQLLAQIMKLSYFPQIKVVHTSKIFHGQLYVPLVNWLLMVGTVLVAAIYNNTTSLGNAYGVCVMFVTFFDTCMVTLAALIVWRIKPYYVVLPWLIIACLDGTYLSSALTKVPNGAWFTLTLAGILASIFILWRFGKEQQWQAEAADRFPTTHFVQKRVDGQVQLSSRFGGDKLSVIKGFGIFFDKAGETTPIIFSQFVTKLVAAPEVMVYFHLRPLETPTVPLENRHGYMDEVITPNLASLVFGVVRDHIIRKAAEQHVSLDEEEEAEKEKRCTTPSTLAGSTPAATTPGADNDDRKTFSNLETENDAITPADDEHDADHQKVEPPKHTKEFAGPGDQAEQSKEKDRLSLPSKDTDKAIAAELSKLQAAYDHQVLYIVGKEQMRIKEGTKIWRTVLLKSFLWIRENTRTKIANLRVPTERVIEVGFVKDV